MAQGAPHRQGSRAWSQTHDKFGHQTDNLSGPRDQTTRRYDGSKSGIWRNNNGTVVGKSITEDSDVSPQKSTGDLAVSRYIKQRRAAGTKGY